MSKIDFMKKILRHTAILGIASALFVGAVLAEDAPYKTGEEPIAPGVVHESHYWNTNYGPIRFEVLECDLTNPNLDLRLVAGQGEYTERATVPAMAENTGAVAMINGDFFNMALQGSPIGPSLVNGQLGSSPAVIEGIYSLGITADNTAIIEAMSYNGSVTAADGATFPIDGLNKTYYWHDPSGQESHTNTIQMYNDLWGSSSRGHSDNTEVLIGADGTVEQISRRSTFPFEVPDGKTILQVNGIGETFIDAHCPIGSKVQITSQVLPDRNWKFLVGGHALLADNGHMVPYYKDLSSLAGTRARTAAAVSQEGKTLWLITAEGRTNRSVGAQLSTMGYFMEYLGAWRAVNLDGGGSTTMVVQHLGETTLSTVTAPEGNGMLRPVVNGIGIYNSTPVGDVAGFVTSGPSEMVVGETRSFGVTKAWDANYHALSVNAADYSITSANGMGAAAGLNYVALQPGAETVNITSSSGATVSRSLNILGEEGLTSLRVETDQFMVSDGSVVHATLYGTKTDGTEVLLDPRVVNWSVEGFSGSGSNGYLTIDATGDAANGKIVASLGSLRGEALLGNNSYNLLDLYIDNTTYWLNGDSYSLDQPPIIVEGRTMVPLRLITEALGGQVTWTDHETPIAIEYGGHHIALTVGDRAATVDGNTVETDVPAQIVGDRTLVPIRFVSEQLGMDIVYDDASRCVSICALK